MKIAERRYTPITSVRIETDSETQGRTISGHCAVFNSPSVVLTEPEIGQFIEVIEPGAFAESLATNDIRALYNHNNDLILGRRRPDGSGTLILREDDEGLFFQCMLGNSDYANALIESIERNDIDGCSFGFDTCQDSFTMGDDGTPLRTLHAINLLEVTLGCVFPAYPESSIAVRQIQQLREQSKKNRRAIQRLKIFSALDV